MNSTLKTDADKIIDYAIKEALPYDAVKKHLNGFSNPNGRTILIAIGKAAYSMGKAASEAVKYDKGLIVTKYNHSKVPLPNIEIIEAGHPILDDNSVLGAKKAIELVRDLNENDVVIFLISGGGSALFEEPACSLDTLQDINDQLIKCGASIGEINTIRKRLSKVKGGKFGKLCSPAKVINIILSDIIGDPLDMIASGPTYPDSATYKDALNIIDKYKLNIDISLLSKEDITEQDNIENHIILSNRAYVHSAALKAKELGYDVIEVDEPLTCDVNNAREILSSYIKDYDRDTAVFFGGEITVKVKGDGIGGRNQHLALSLLDKLNKNTCVFCVGSDGTDGPTDAAGAYVDGLMSLDNLDDYLDNNDSYHGLKKLNSLIITGPTGTNVCDLYGMLYRK